MKKRLFGIGLFAAMAVMFFASCANGDESSENNDLYYVLTKAEKPVIKFTVEDSVKALIPEGYEAVIQVIDFKLGEIRGDGEEYVLPEDLDISKTGIMFEIIKKGVVQDHQIPIEVLLSGDNPLFYGWTASLSINKMTKQTTGDKDDLGIIYFQEFLTKENLGEDNTINITLSSFNKTTD